MGSSELEVFIPLSEIFPGMKPDYSDFKDILKKLSRTDTLFSSARLNSIVSSMNETHVKRQQEALEFLSIKKEHIDVINDLIKKRESVDTVTICWRGQILELIRWAIFLCEDKPDDGNTFQNPELREEYFKALLIANEIWSKRVFSNRFDNIDDVDIATVRKKALGSFRKSVESKLKAPDPVRALGRGKEIFTRLFHKHYKDFEREFEDSTGLSINQYYICSCAMIYHFVDSESRNNMIFNSKILGNSTVNKEIVQKYLSLESQSVSELKAKLLKRDIKDINDFSDLPYFDYRPMREKPILRAEDGRAIVIDPVFYHEKASIGPLFHLPGNKFNLSTSAFGNAFEEYCCEILRYMYPDGSGILVKRLFCNRKVLSHNGEEYEIDAYLNNETDLIIFEMKSGLLKEETILTEDHEDFLNELRKKYGVTGDTSNRQKIKGVGQLARIIDFIARDNIAKQELEIQSVRMIYPILLIHDQLLEAPLTGNFLHEEFKSALNPDKENSSVLFEKNGMAVASLIVMSIDDLENLEDSVRNFSLTDLLRDYSTTCQDCMKSLQNYIIDSKYCKLRKESERLTDVTIKLIDETKSFLFPDGPKS